MVTYLRMGKNILLVLALLGIGLGCGQTAAPEPTSEANNSAAPTSITAADSDSPEAVTAAFIDLCLAGDIVTARSLLTEATRESVDTFSGGNPCGDFDSDTFRGLERTLYENQVVGATAHITWEWPLLEERRFIPRYAFVSAQENGEWRIMSGATAGVIATLAPTPIPPTPDYENVTSDVPVDVEASEATGLPIPEGCQENEFFTESFLVYCRVYSDRYTAKAIFDFYLYQMPLYGWHLKNGAESVDALITLGSTGGLTRANMEWVKGGQEVRITLHPTNDLQGNGYTSVSIK